VNIDASQWHAWAVEWTTDHIAYYVDGKQWWETTDKSHLPPGPMHLTIQLDYFGGGAAETQQHVDWVRQYDASAGAPAGNGSSASGGSAAPRSTGDSASSGNSGSSDDSGSSGDSGG
jgi:beta-glucanase (GH16 family)